MPRSARVAELVDAPDSKSGGSNTVGVRFPSRAPKANGSEYSEPFFVLKEIETAIISCKTAYKALSSCSNFAEMKSTLQVYNSLTRQKEIFTPLNPPKVGMYVCGPTVYNDVHLGNLRTFTSFDLIYRWLTECGYSVRYVRNITDVGHLENDADEGEDKIGKKARLEQLEPMEIVQKYTNGFREVMRIFGNFSPSIEPTATGHIVEQIEMVKQIMARGLAYEVNGSVYFDVRSYAKTESYGALSGRQIDELMSGSRDLDGQSEKRDALDFALWKKASPEHIMRWPSPWGEGFPGWHLECSVMSSKYLGMPFDIHGGGMDLKFPHHECEIAQNVAATGCQRPVNYWLHGNMLTLNGKKMSKSDGNFLLPGDLITGNHALLNRGYSPMAIRFFFMQAHYGSTLDMSEDALTAAEKGYQRLAQAYGQLKNVKGSGQEDPGVEAWAERCQAAMNDDFNSPILVAQLFEAAKWIQSAAAGGIQLSSNAIQVLSTEFERYFIRVLGLTESRNESEEGSIQHIMELILEIRREARIKKDWSTSDLIRDRLSRAGISINDGKDNSTWHYES